MEEHREVPPAIYLPLNNNAAFPFLALQKDSLWRFMPSILYFQKQRGSSGSFLNRCLYPYANSSHFKDFRVYMPNKITKQIIYTDQEPEP